MTEFNLTESLEQLRDMKQELGPAIAKVGRLEKKIKQHILDTGETAEVKGVTIRLRTGYTRITWNSKALEGYAVAHPDILALRSESEIKPSVSIRVEQ